MATSRFSVGTFAPLVVGVDIARRRGRRARIVARRVGGLNAVDASERAFPVVRERLMSLPNVTFSMRA